MYNLSIRRQQYLHHIHIHTNINVFFFERIQASYTEMYSSFRVQDMGKRSENVNNLQHIDQVMSN